MALAVAIPVGIFVVGPHVAQSILDHTTVSLPNLTQSACDTNYTWLFNHAKIQVPSIGPIKLSSTIESFTQEVWTTSCVKDGAITPGVQCGENATEQQMGYYTSPTITVSPGDNRVFMNVDMTSNNLLILSAWVQPLWLLQQKARLILKAKVNVKVLGITFSGLTMRNDMTCTGSPQQPTIAIPSSVCHPDDPTKHDPYTTTSFTAVCEVGDSIASTSRSHSAIATGKAAAALIFT